MIHYDSNYWEDVDRVIQNIPNCEKLKNRTVLITGGTGMICSSVVEVLMLLNKKYSYNIKILLAGRSKARTEKRFYEMTEGLDYQFVQYDATQEQVIDCNTDYVIHGASNANPTVYVKQPVETMLANIIGLNNLLQMAVKTNSKRVLYISSSEVYGNNNEQRSFEENDYGFVDILNMRASYPSSKRAAETMCVAYSYEYGVDTVIVRPGHIYGPTITASDTRASAEFTRKAAGKQNIVMKSAGSQLRSYCYTLDTASAILAVLLNGESCNAYNISNKASIVTIKDVAVALAQNAGTQVVFEEATETEKKGFNLMTNSSLKADKLESLGWKATFSLEEGTKKTIQYYREI